jgi:hypothetical protein
METLKDRRREEARARRLPACPPQSSARAGCRRHDFDALAAYESYCNDAEGRRADDSLVLGGLPTAVHVPRSETRGAEETGRSRPRLPRPNGGKVRAAQRDVCDGHEGVSAVSRCRAWSGGEAGQVGEELRIRWASSMEGPPTNLSDDPVDSAVPAITALLIAARSDKILK